MTNNNEARSAAERAADKKYPITSGKGSLSGKKFLAHVRGVILSVTNKGTVSLINYRYDHKSYDFYIGAGTSNLLGELSQLVMFDAIIDCTGGMRFALVLASPDQYAVFDAYESLSEKIEGVRDWLALNDNERSSILRQRSGNTYPVVHQDENEPDSYKKLLNRYRFTKCTYSEAQQTMIDSLIMSGSSIGRRENHSRKKLEYLLNISPVSSTPRCASYEQLTQTLDRYVFGQSKAKEQLKLLAITSAQKAHRGFKCIIVGPMGSGKETLALAFAKGLGQPYEVRPLAGISTAVEVVGLDSSYENSDIGPFPVIFKRNKSSEMTLILTGIDRLGTGTLNGDPRHAISSLFDERSELNDQYLDVPLDCSNTAIVATAVSTRNLPDYLLSNALIIELDSYSFSDKKEIVKQFLLPQALNELGLSPNSVHFTDDALDRVVTESNELGLDKIRQNVDDCVGFAARFTINSGEELKVIDGAILDKCLTPFHRADEPISRFNRNNHLYHPRVKEEFLHTCDELTDDQLAPGERRILLRKLEILSALVPCRDTFSQFDIEQLRANLDQRLFGQTEAKDCLVNAINAQMRQGATMSGVRLGFGGPAGSGKTSLAEAIATAQGAAFIKVSLNGVVDPAILKGTPHEAGRIMSEIAKVGSLDAVILLDEVDKCGPLVSKTLVDLLDDSHQFTDNLLGFPADTSSIRFIATFNDPTLVDPLIMDRLTVIEVPGYTFEEMSVIIRSYLFPSLAKQNALEKIEISNDVILYLIKCYCPSIGVREVKKAFTRIIEALLRNHPSQNQFAITADTITKVLGAPTYHSVMPCSPTPGCANALGVHGNYGMSFPIEVLLTDDDRVTITGLAQDGVVESVKDAIAFINHTYPDFKIKSGVHIKIGTGGVKKDGPSAGLAIVMALLSASCNRAIDSTYSFTGELSLHGRVMPVGGIHPKVHAAFLAGHKTVFIPAANAADIERRNLNSYSSIEIVPVQSVEDVVRHVFKDAI